MHQPRTSSASAAPSVSKAMAIKPRPLIGGLLVSMLAAGLLVVGGTPAAAQKVEQTSPQPSSCSTGTKCHTTTVRPPVLGKARFTCHDEQALVVAKLRNRNKTTMEYMVILSGADYAESYVVTLPAHSAELVQFGGVPNGTYLLGALNAAGDLVAHTSLRVNC